MDLKHAVAVLLRRWWVVLGALAVTLGATYAYLGTVERVYTATASIAVLPGADDRAQDGFAGLIGPLLPTLAERLESDDVLEDVIAQVPDAPSLEELRGMVSGVAVKNTLELRVVVEAPDPQEAADLANHAAQALPRNDISGGLVSYSALDLARPPSDPSAPQPRLTLALAGLLGLGLGVGAALAMGRPAKDLLPPLSAGGPHPVAGEPVRGTPARGR